MAQELSDAQILSCPEPLEEMFIHRGRRDLITPQAGKRKILHFDFCTNLKGKRLFKFLKTSNQVSCYTFQLKNWSLSVITAGRLCILGACVLDTCTDQSDWSLVIHFGHLPY